MKYIDRHKYIKKNTLRQGGLRATLSVVLPAQRCGFYFRSDQEPLEGLEGEVLGSGLGFRGRTMAAVV